MLRVGRRGAYWLGALDSLGAGIMGWGILLAVLLALGLATYSKIERTAKADGIEAARANLQKTADENNADAEKGAAVILAKRPARAATVKAKQEKDREVAKVAEQTNPALAAWAEARVPDAVIDELWANAQGKANARQRPSGGELGAAVRSGGANAAEEAGNRTTIERIRSFVTGRD